MSERDKKLNKGELIDIKSLIGDADGGDYSLDDIMSEYGVPPPEPSGEGGDSEERFRTIEWGSVPLPKPRFAKGGKVVAFPGGAPPKSEPEEEPEFTPEELDSVPEDLQEESPLKQETASIIPFPEEESVLSAFFKDLGKRADDYADHMFEEDEAIDKQEVRRLERLIPGTDQEEPEEEPSGERWRPPRYQEPPPPDTAPRELAKRFGRRLKWMRIRVLFLFLLTLLALAQTALPMLNLPWPAPLDRVQVQCWVSAALLGTGILLALDVLAAGIGRAFRLRFGMDTLAALSCGFTLADGVKLAMDSQSSGRMPYTLVCLAGLFFLLHGSYHKRCALRLSCRGACAASSPYRVTLEPGKWNDRDTYCKWSGDAERFGSQIQADDGAQWVFRVVCPLLFLGDVAFALMVSVYGGHPERLLWALSALFTATTAFGSSLVYGRSFHKTARRLFPNGSVLAGWPGIACSRRGDRVLLTDGDLFPPGYVEFNGYKVMGDYPAERVVAYTATLIRDSGSGLEKLFHDQLRSMGGLMRTASGLVCHEGGGLSANIRGDQVLVGSAAFMKLMEVRLPQGLNVKNAVFCAIDGKLAGIFALSYTLPDTVFPALDALMQERVGPVLATRDFNVIPAMLQQRFKLAADRMAFPPVERRRELSDLEQEHDGILTALLYREGLLPFAESIAASKRLRWATRLGAALCCSGSLLGMLLSAYLTSVGAYTSLSPLNLLIYLLTWLAPIWFLSGWVHRF